MVQKYFLTIEKTFSLVDNSITRGPFIRSLVSERIKGHLVAAFRSPLMKALGRSVETLGL